MFFRSVNDKFSTWTYCSIVNSFIVISLEWNRAGYMNGEKKKKTFLIITMRCSINIYWKIDKTRFHYFDFNWHLRFFFHFHKSLVIRFQLIAFFYPCKWKFSGKLFIVAKCFHFFHTCVELINWSVRNNTEWGSFISNSNIEWCKIGMK